MKDSIFDLFDENEDTGGMGFSEDDLLDNSTNDDFFRDESLDTTEPLQNVTYLDTNNDGLIDAWSSQTYSNFDGIVNTYSEHSILDTNGDGVCDHQEVLPDTDRDQVLDNFQEIHYIDGDNDDIIDSYVYNYDLSIGNGINYGQNFDLSDSNQDWNNISGDPANDMQNWHMQTHDDTCAVVCQEFVLKENGYKVSEDQLRDLALENGWYTDGGGTPAEHVGDLLEAYGMDVDKTKGASIDDIENCLDNGGSVIVGVDADEIWAQSHDYITDEILNDPPFAPGGDANHAVEVIGIDSSDPNNVMVILNDSGSPDGCGSMIPLDDFMSAWNDSGNMLVTAYE